MPQPSADSAPAPASLKRPRAFGRTSNVWQYVETVQQRSTPVDKYRKPSNVDEGDEDDADDDEHDVPVLSGDALHPTSDGRASVDHRNSQVTKTLPELAAPSSLAKKASTVSVGLPSPTNNNSGKKFNGGDVIKRIQALGTSASAPVLSPVAPVAAVPTVVTQSTSAMTTLSDAERLRNDFNSQRGKLYFGCSVAFELFNGHLMMVSAPDGAVGVQALEKMQLKSGRHRAVFTLIDLTDVRSASSIRYGDSVWLQLSVGPGETTWEQGGVLGAKVREAPQLKALALADDESIRNDAQAPLVVGHPVPVRAYLPKNRDDVDAQVDEIQSRVRNKSSKMLGKWIIRSAVQRRRRPNDNFVYNTDEIYLEQDWFYLGVDSDAGVAVLRQLPPAAALKEIKLGEYVVERRGAWRLRLLDSSNGSAGLSLAQQQMEKLLLRAKTQLKQSRRMRAGQTKQYGGAAFVGQLRAQLQETTRDCDAQYFASQERRLSQLPQHLSSKADTLIGEKTVGFEVGEQGEDDQVYESRPPSAATSSARSQSTSSSRGGSAEPKRDVITANDGVCSLCQSSSLRYNLCCQIHHVMDTLHDEKEQACAAQAAAKVHTQAQRHHGVPTASKASDHLMPGDTRERQRIVSPIITPPSPSPSPSLAASASAPQLVSNDSQSRLLTLFAQQDQQMQDVIRFKEKTAQAALVAEAQARVGLSPVATHFRDRFKHVTKLAQQHEQEVGSHLAGSESADDIDGIGGHFQKLHLELKREETQRREHHQRDRRANRAKKHLESLRGSIAEDGEQEDDGDDALLLDTTTMCPLELPGEGFDVYGHPLPPAIRCERLFPTEEEMDKLPPVDTKQMNELYLHNKAAVVEMLDGFLELSTVHIAPNLSAAMDGRNRGALVEFLDFAARAAEFVCARRVQVRVAKLLHEVAASDVGDFESFCGSYEALREELEHTAAFMRFYRDKGQGKKGKKKGKERGF